MQRKELAEKKGIETGDGTEERQGDHKGRREKEEFGGVWCRPREGKGEEPESGENKERER
jgi:hypothetical protein